MKITAAAIAALVIGQIVAFSAGALDIVASIAGDVCVIAVIWLVTRQRDAFATLGIRRVPARFAIGALLVGLAAWYPALRLVLWIQPPGEQVVLKGIIEQSPLFPTLAAVALLPAIAEEVVFRGVLARGLATRVPWPVALVLSAGVFSAYHMIPAQMLGTLPLALALGFFALRADSIIPSMILHATNNAVAILVSREEVPTSWLARNPDLVLVVAIAIMAGGLALGAKGVA